MMTSKVARGFLAGMALALGCAAEAQEQARTNPVAATSRSIAPTTDRFVDRPRQRFLPLEWSNDDWRLVPWGYFRLAYESVESDDRYSFIGRNDGFLLDNARIGLDVEFRDTLSFLISFEGASDVQEDTNTPLGEIDVRLRDVYARWEIHPYIGIQGGQIKAPFAAEELQATVDLLFVSRSVGWEGVLVGRGFEEPGISLGRQIGVMLSPRAPIRFGDFGAVYYLMVGNGNDENQLLNDNSKVAVIGRVEALYSSFVTLGAAGYTNERRTGTPPNQADEEDVGVAADLYIHPGPIELFAQFGQVETDFDTAGVSSRIRRAGSVQGGYRFDLPWGFSLTPAYRYAYYDPWANAGSNAMASANRLALEYHTFGVRVKAHSLPLSFFVNYTLTEEQAPREVDNDRLQLLAQVVF